MKYDIEYIEKIAKIVTENNLSEIYLEDGDQVVSVRKEGAVTGVNPVVNQAVPPATVQVQAKEEKKEEAPKGKTITSPMVGAFYAAPAPGAKPFVKVGDTVTVGQVVCIVEAMKLMNEIESDVSGKVTQICVEDGQSVEYGQVLMYVE